MNPRIAPPYRRRHEYRYASPCRVRTCDNNTEHGELLCHLHESLYQEHADDAIIRGLRPMTRETWAARQNRELDVLYHVGRPAAARIYNN